MRDEEQLEESDENSRARKLKTVGGRHVSEEKNKFALSVLRRVRVKLEGREPDSLRKVSLSSLSLFYKNLIFYLSVKCRGAGGLPDQRSHEHREPCPDVRRVDCLDIKIIKYFVILERNIFLPASSVVCCIFMLGGAPVNSFKSEIPQSNKTSIADTAREMQMFR